MGFCTDDTKVPPPDVCITVTEPSPDNQHPPAPAPSRLGDGQGSTLVHVLVHRESEEYQTDLEDGNIENKKGELPLNMFQYDIKPFQTILPSNFKLKIIFPLKNILKILFAMSPNHDYNVMFQTGKKNQM